MRARSLVLERLERLLRTTQWFHLTSAIGFAALFAGYALLDLRAGWTGLLLAVGLLDALRLNVGFRRLVDQLRLEIRFCLSHPSAEELRRCFFTDRHLWSRSAFFRTLSLVVGLPEAEATDLQQLSSFMRRHLRTLRPPLPLLPLTSTLGTGALWLFEGNAAPLTMWTLLLLLLIATAGALYLTLRARRWWKAVVERYAIWASRLHVYRAPYVEPGSGYEHHVAYERYPDLGPLGHEQADDT